MKKKDLLNEIAGVPRAIDFWVNLYVDIIVESIDDILKKGPETQQTGTNKNPLTGKVKTITVKMSDKTIKGSDFMRQLGSKYGGDLESLLKAKEFQELPIWVESVDVEIYGLPEEDFIEVFKEKTFVNASMRSYPNKLKMKKIGKIDIISGIGFMVNPMLSNKFWGKGIPSEYMIGIKNMLKSVMAHELLHTYQMYNQLKSNKATHFGKEQVLNSMVKPMSSGVLHQWDDFLRLIYLHLSFEINARVTELYYEMKSEGVSTKEEFLNHLKNSNTWKEMKSLENFNADKFLSEFKVPDVNVRNLSDFGKMMDDGIRLAQHGIKHGEAKETALKKLVSVWNSVLKGGVAYFKKQYEADIPMEEVPKHVRENPELFFKFFEKRFHKKAEKFKRKLHKLYSIVVE